MLKNPVLVRNMQAAIDAGKAIHLMGLVGTGGVHSHAEHWFGVLEMAKHMGAKQVYLHCIMDGRDTDPHSGKGFLADLRQSWTSWAWARSPASAAATTPWTVTTTGTARKKAYAAFVYGEGPRYADAQQAIEAS